MIFKRNSYPGGDPKEQLSRQDAAPSIGAMALGGNTQVVSGQFGEGSASRAATHLRELGVEPVLKRKVSVAHEMTAPRVAPNGSFSEHLWGITIMGDSALAIVATNRPGDSISKIDIVKIGLGANNPSGELSTGRVVASVSMDTLSKPRENGAIKSWEDITVGRRTGDSQPMIGIDGVEASRGHGKFTIRSGSDSVEYTDSSTNGTTIVTTHNMHQTVRDSAITQILSQSEMWSPSVAAQMPAVRIVNP